MQNGKRLHLTHLSQECRALLDRAGDLVEVNRSEDPQYHLATDRIIASLTYWTAPYSVPLQARSASE